MKKLQLLIEVTHEDYLYGSSPEEMAYFFGEVLGDEVGLILHSNHLGDSVGTVKVLKVLP